MNLTVPALVSIDILLQRVALALSLTLAAGFLPFEQRQADGTKAPGSESYLLFGLGQCNVNCPPVFITAGEDAVIQYTQDV